MNRLIKKPHLVFFPTIPVLILWGIFKGDTTLDINIHDTYLIISYLHVAIFISIVFAILGGGYWIVYEMGGKLISWLSVVHIILTLGGLLTIYVLPFFTLVSSDESSFPAYEDAIIKNSILLIILITMIFGQFLFFLNLILALSKKKS